MNYSKGIIAIPKVTGDIEIIVTTEGMAINLFDPSTALYNRRIKSTGESASANGMLVTAPIDITNISTLTVSGITEALSDSYGYYALACTYSDSAGTIKVDMQLYTAEATYVFDVAALKTSYPTGVYLRFCFCLNADNNSSSSSISAIDVPNLKIYGS